jgi:hypothetical protein
VPNSELLGAERGRAEDDLADGVVDGLLEARHVGALLLRTEVHEALQLGPVELLAPVARDADHLLDARHSHARERHVDGGALGLNVERREHVRGRLHDPI